MCVSERVLIESVYSHVGPYYSCVSPVLHPRVKLIKRGAVGQEGESKCLVILNTGRRRGGRVEDGKRIVIVHFILRQCVCVCVVGGICGGSVFDLGTDLGMKC